MKQAIFVGTIALLAGSLVAAESNLKDEVQKAAKKLAADSYSWKTTIESAGGGGGGGQNRPGPTEGKVDKDGTFLLTMTRGDNTTQAVLKGDKGAVETQDGWKSLAELTQGGGGQQNRGSFMARSLQTMKRPAAEAEDLLAKAKDLKKAEDVYSGDLTEEGAKQYLSRRRGAQAPEPQGAKGSVKFWVKDGALTKYEYNVQGKVTMGQDNREVEVNRTTTVVMKDVGATKLELPEGAKAKL